MGFSGSNVEKQESLVCAWPVFTCPHTPGWQLFSACRHPVDSATAAMWHSVRGPFSVPVGIPGHTCEWEIMDHHMAGCKVCGRVHRCETDVCEEILEGEPGEKSIWVVHWFKCECMESERRR